MNNLVAKTYALILKYPKIFSRMNFTRYLAEFTTTYVSRKKKPKILSFGSGGQVKQILSSYGLSFTEIDIDEKRDPDLVQDIQDMKDVKSNSIDVIYCLEVLEHVQDPKKAVSELRRVLKKEGVVIASTPFLFPIHDEPYDFYRYTKYGIEELFKEFDLKELRARNSYAFSVYVALIRVVSVGSIFQRLIGIILLPLFVLLLPLFWLLSLVITHDQATTGYMYVAVKK